MTISTNNQYLKRLLEDLIATHETEIDYLPIEVELKPEHISAEDIDTILSFVSEPRKRLFIFKLENNPAVTENLFFRARRAFLNQIAEINLQRTSHEPKINPLKKELNNPPSIVRAAIQIQRSFALPKQARVIKTKQKEKIHQVAAALDVILTSLDELAEFPNLARQLQVLNIHNIQDTASQKIKEQAHAFTDGIIPGNLPKGFYIDYEKQALCYTSTPHRLPSALAPILETPKPVNMPSVEQLESLLPTLQKTIIEHLLGNNGFPAQKDALLTALPAHVREITALLSVLKATDAEFVVPLLAKLFILGGEAHMRLFVQLLTVCINKNINIEFLKDAAAQNALLSPHGLKNLQKLLQLPIEQREWWNTLAAAHLRNEHHHFDFNAFFEAYTQIFLTQVSEKNLTLPHPCPIQHEGHFLITLNRVMEVLEKAQNPQEQCSNLANLDWGPTGVHYAMAQAPKEARFCQVAACMQLRNPEDTRVNPETVCQQIIEDEHFDLDPWLYRYIGQHWKAEIRLSDIQAQFTEIQTIPSWTKTEKNQLAFILACSFADESTLTTESWKKAIKNCISLIQSLEANERSELINALVRCFNFKPSPSLIQIQQIIELCLELKTNSPELNFRNELLAPLISSLENEGFELINTLQARGQKIGQERDDQLRTIVTFTTMLQNQRENLFPNIIRMLAALNEPDLNEVQIGEVKLAIEDLRAKKGQQFSTVLLSLLAKINIEKSQTLPKIVQILALIRELANSPETIPVDCRTEERQESWLKDLIISRTPLPGCVLGSGDISKLDDLIVDALADAIKKRSGVLKIDSLRDTLDKYLGYKVVPTQLRDQLHRELWPLFDALNDLVVLLQGPDPQFEEILEKFRIFEEKKTTLLEANYAIKLLGSSKGEYILSFLLTGERKEADKQTGSAFALALGKVHTLIADEINTFFSDERNKNKAKDLDAATTLKWLAEFNDTHTLHFLFRDELVQKKVLPALKKTLTQLDTQDIAFETSILQAAAELEQDKPSDRSLQDYKIKIESIASYLNLLIDIKAKFPIQFPGIYRQLNTGALARLNYSQKKTLVSTLLHANPESLDRYLQLTSFALDENPEADETAIDRAVNNLETLFELEDLELETQIMFFKMSVNHNLRNPSPFPLTILNELKQTNLDEEAKSLIIKQIIQILRYMPDSESPDTIRKLIQQTQSFLTENPQQATLCIALLKQVSSHGFNRDVDDYSEILRQLASPTREFRESKTRLVTILTYLAENQKDDTVNLPTLLDITKGLGRRPPEIVDQVLQLFATPPYPSAKRLNSVLGEHGSEKIQAYCQSFDTNPFAKTGEPRALDQQFATHRVKEALLNLKDLMRGITLPHSLQLQLARQLSYIETLGYTDPLNPYDFSRLKKLTACPRRELKERATLLLEQLRNDQIPAEQLELTRMELVAYLREIYFRSTGLFPNSTQILVLLLSLHSPYTNLLMRIETGEGKSLITPMFAVLQWAQGGTVDVCTANGTLLSRDYENSCEPFFKFLGIKSALIRANSQPEEYQLNGINCSTGEDMSLFRQAAKEAGKEARVQNGGPIHLVIDESDDALLDQNTLNKLVAEIEEKEEDNPSQWVYPLAYQFINLPLFRNVDPALGKIWDEEEDLDQFRLFIIKEINEKYNGDADKLNFIAAATNTQLREWIRASCKAALLVENKHFIVRPIKEKDETGSEVTKKIVCIPLIKSVPKGGSIFTDGVQQALQARLIAERPEQARYFVIDPYPPVLSSQSIQNLIRFYQETNGRILGISGTPGDQTELQYLATLLGTQALGVAPHAGDKRIKHPPIFTFSRDETIQAIHQAIDRIKRPVTKPNLEFDADTPTQTLEERDAFILRKEQALRQWSQTQTQPVLIVCEDFEQAQKIGQSFDAYKAAGFKIQVVTGKESPEELNRIIKQAGQANTITIGTAMLARGIDINPGDHPEGLFVIQPCIDSERITTQIAGRAARNGKPGQWLPIYQVEPPKTWLEKVMYFVFPWYRQRKCQEAVTDLQAEIRLQANVDRLYTQAIDQAQQALMQQVYAWESFLLELYPTDLQVRSELYQWRETLLSELTQAQETSVSQDTLESSIAQFQNAICKIWEMAKEEKWVAKAQKATDITAEQNLRLNYLKQLDLSQELKIQRALAQKSQPVIAGTETLMHYNLDAMIDDKAGAVLQFTNPTGEEKQQLELAQIKQLLPTLIGELCSFYPHAINEFSSANGAKLPPAILEAFASLVNKVIGKNKILFGSKSKEKIIQSITQFYQEDLKQADIEAIRELLNKIKPLILEQDQTSKVSLVDKFKMQGLILTFSKLYEQSGLPGDEELTGLKTSYSNEIMKLLAEHLLQELAWIKEDPQPLSAFFERKVAKDAAEIIYNVAEKVHQSPNDEAKIHELFVCLKEQHFILKDKYLFSIRHRNPRDVINTALSALEALNVAPHCSREAQEQCHDKVLFTHHLRQFDNLLRQISISFRKSEDPVWNHLEEKLHAIITTNENQSHVITELYEAVERFSNYNAYLPYRNHLRKMKELLAGSVKALADADDGLKEDNLDGLFMQKTSQLASLLHLNEDQIRIQKGCNGMRTYIEIQVENAPLIKGFTGYSSSSMASLRAEKEHIALQKETFERNRETLLNLSNREFIENLPPVKKAEFQRLLHLKDLLAQDWHKGFDEETVNDLPKSIQALYKHAERVRQWECPSSMIGPEQLREIAVTDWSDNPRSLLEHHARLCHELQIVLERKHEAQLLAEKNEKEISGKESKEKELDKRQGESDCGVLEKISIGKDKLALKIGLSSLRSGLVNYKENVEKISQEERSLRKQLQSVILGLNEKRMNYVAMRKEQAKISLTNYIQENTEALIRTMEEEFKAADTTAEQLMQLEAKKTHYQTRRFDDVGELLEYEAGLVGEEGDIPAIRKRESTAFDRLITTFFDRKSLIRPTMEAPALMVEP